MSLHLFDTATREQREFVPLRAGVASIYVCGATVQGQPHIGHVRSGLNYDVLRRWLAHQGLDVRLVRNVTDIDDKILAKAADHGYGEYGGRLRDPFGHQWMLSQKIEDLTADETQARLDAMT